MEMPVVNTCAAQQCAYNLDQVCHALAITVGNSQEAACETYFGVSFKGGDRSTAGHVGACKMSDCTYNVDLECQAPGISVSYRGDVATCATYQSAPVYQPA